MALYLSHSSALQYWRSPSAVRTFRRADCSRGDNRSIAAAQQAVYLLPGPAPCHSPSLRLDGPDGDSVPVLLPNGLDFPLHCLVSATSSRKRTNELICHVDERSARDALFYRVAPGVSVCCPELTLLQLAASLDFVELMRLVYELCGSYALCAANPKGFICWNPDLLTANLERCKAVAHDRSQDHGSIRLRKVLRCVSQGSHSPAETKLAMLLSTPHIYGGLALPAPTMNSRVFLSRKLQKLAGAESYLCDFVWPDKRLVIEYDSDQNHLDAEQHGRDLVKRQLLESDGYHVISVSASQMRNAEHMLQIAQHASKALGVRFRPRARDFDSLWEDFHGKVVRG